MTCTIDLLIDKLNRQLKHAAIQSFSDKFTITSPEVQEVQLYGLRINIREAHAILGALKNRHYPWRLRNAEAEIAALKAELAKLS